MLRIFFLVAGVALAAASPCRGELVAYWDFNSFSTADDTIAADAGMGTLDLAVWNGGVSSFAGTTLNALGDSAGSSLTLRAGAGMNGNGSFIQLQTSLSGFQDPVITFATQGSNEGFNAGTWAWSVDGSSFMNLEGVNTASTTSYSLATVDFSSVSGLTDASDAFFRYTLDGATSTNGNNRIDNLQINATMTAVPEPGSTALLSMIGGAGAIGHRMRRRSAYT